MLKFFIRSIFQKFFPKTKKEKFLSKNYLTKQKFQAFLKCEMSSWIGANQPSSIQSKIKKFHTSFEEYRKIRDQLKTLFKHGKEVRYAKSIEDSISLTMRYIDRRIPVFSAVLGKEAVLSNFDILLPVAKSSWAILSVKSQSSYKRENITELAYQKYVAEKCGLDVSQTILYSINPNYLFVKKIESDQYFVKNNLTAKVNAELPKIQSMIDRYFQVVQSTSQPTSPSLCKFPAECMNSHFCYPKLKDGNIFELREGKEISQKLYRDGIIYLKDIPSDTELIYKQVIQVECEKTGSPHILHEEIQRFLANVSYPLYFLDFETINPAFPLFKRTKPFQHIPVQYSLHIQEKPNSRIKHFSFLAKNKTDPRKKIIKYLSKLISKDGKIVVYDAFFERKVFEECVLTYPEFRGWWDAVSNHILDISIPFKSFYYYHPMQKGRASLKAVLPALTGHNYDGLEIHDGGSANQEFYKYLTTKMKSSEKRKLRKNMEDYCKMDTYALVEILRSLENLVS